MSLFKSLIEPHAPTPAQTQSLRWIYAPYDRNTDRTGPLTEQPAEETGLILIEATAKPLRRPYHKKKLVVLISNMRHFALEQAARGVKILYLFSPANHGQALLHAQRTHSLPPITVMHPAERELRLDLAAAEAEGLLLHYVPDTTWASTPEDFQATYGPFKPGKSYVMDRFYRRMRQQTGILMTRKPNPTPIGGQFSYDPDNRNPYRNEVPVPTPPTFPPDEITREVIALVDRYFPHHFGFTTGFDLPCTQPDNDRLWKFFLTQLLPHFGRFEDAMRDDHLQLFHSKTSVALNLGRLLALDLIRDVAEYADAPGTPLSSVEGFIRQLLGWREFMRHLHTATDGYRLLRGHIPNEPRQVPHEYSPDRPVTKPGAPGLASETWVPGSAPNLTEDPDLDPATPSYLAASLPLPAVYWGAKSGLHCMDTVVAQVIQEGWSHHITRLMVLSNLANLCGFSPRELTDWFWFAYVDAYDWVVEPNVLGMATFADGGLTATKPYISGAAYINKMSNFCPHCQYDPKKSLGPGSCPFTALYWTFLDRNKDRLASNFRMQMPLNTLRKKNPDELVQLHARATEAIQALQSQPRPPYGIQAKPNVWGAPGHAASSRDLGSSPKI